MGQSFSYVHERQWITEGSVWRPPEPITLRDEAGAVIGSSVISTLLMTLYDVATDTIIGGVEQTDIKNTRSCTISPQGLLVITLLVSDTVILDPTKFYEIRRVLIEYTWPLVPTKADAIEITCVVKNVNRRPYVAP